MIALFSGIWVGYLVSTYTEQHWSDSDNMEKEVRVARYTRAKEL